MATETPPWVNCSPGNLDIELPEVHATPVDPAVAAAASAARGWARIPLDQRATCLRAAAGLLDEKREDLAAGIAIETGKPLTEARGEVGAVIAKIDLTIDDARRHLAEESITDGPHPAIVRRVPRGPAAVIGPFNFPLHLAHGALVAHLLAGNTVVFKPSPLAAVVAADYARLMASCLPDGVFNLVQGGAPEGGALCLDPRIRAVCFTGSLDVGRSLAAALARDFSKDLALELGGKNAVLICADADLDEAAARTAEGACLTCGQRCNATTRILVERAVADAFLPRLVAALEKFEPGDPLDPTTHLGPLVSESAVRRYESLLASPGDWIVPGGVEPVVNGQRGWYVRPAIVESRDPVPPSEAFVPIVTFTVVDDADAMVRAHNATPFGLTASIFTRSEARFRQLADEVLAGNIYANLSTTFSPSTLPFGGLGESGNGRPGGRGFIRFTTGEQSLQMATNGFAEPQ